MDLRNSSSSTLQSEVTTASAQTAVPDLWTWLERNATVSKGPYESLICGSVSENVGLDPGLGEMAARDSDLGRDPAGGPSHWFHCSRPLDPTQLQSRHRQVELVGPRPVATWTLSVPNGAGEARAPPVISSIDRRARVGSAGMNPLPCVPEAHRFKVVLR
ncbi:hypothetical protein LA080_006614 [Diaporthe eres]|nr:hypothetical protein LA080_006614 [Diaporthe eres]